MSGILTRSAFAAARSLMIVAALLGVTLLPSCGKAKADPAETLVATMTELNKTLDAVKTPADADVAASKVAALTERWTAEMRAAIATVHEDPTQVGEFARKYEEGMKRPLAKLDRNFRRISRIPGVGDALFNALDEFTAATKEVSEEAAAGVVKA